MHAFIFQIVISVWLKSDLYFCYHIEDMIAPITNQIVTFMGLKVFWKFWPFDLSKLHARGDTKGDFYHLQYIALHLKYAIWLVEIMTQYANTKFTQNSLEHDQ